MPRTAAVRRYEGFASVLATIEKSVNRAGSMQKRVEQLREALHRRGARVVPFCLGVPEREKVDELRRVVRLLPRLITQRRAVPEKTRFCGSRPQ
jgi:hypothetical protein